MPTTAQAAQQRAEGSQAEDVSARRRLEEMALRAITLGYRVEWQGQRAEPRLVVYVEREAYVAYYSWADPRRIHSTSVTCRMSELLLTAERLTLLHAQLTEVSP